MKRTAYVTQMTFDIPESEKKVAEEGVKSFEKLTAHLRRALNHLDILYEPFRAHEQLDPQEVSSHRVALRRYRDKVKDNFSEVLQEAHNCVVLMGEFHTDTHIVELMNSFIESMKDVEKQINMLLSLFSDVGRSDFRNGIVKGIEGVRKQVLQVKELVDDRILSHIETNILAKNWVDNVTDENQDTIYNKLPFAVQLFNEKDK